MVTGARGIHIGATLGRALILSVCWWAVTEGDPAALAMAPAAILAALYLSLRLSPPQAVRVLPMLRFVPIFLWRSLVAGADVAWRAMAPKMPLQVSLREYRTELPEGLARVIFANIVSLLPGTLCADLRDDVLCLHVLSDAAGDESGLRRLEDAVSRVFSGS